MCRQLKAAQKETEKLQAAGDAYKRELLQQKLSDTEWGLAREQDRAKEAEADQAGGCLPFPPSCLFVQSWCNESELRLHRTIWRCFWRAHCYAT